MHGSRKLKFVKVYYLELVNVWREYVVYVTKNTKFCKRKLKFVRGGQYEESIIPNYYTLAVYNI